MRKYAEKLRIERLLIDTEVIIHTRLSSPAYVKRTVDVSLRPLHYLAKLIPIFYLLKRQMLNGSARDYKAVVIIALDLVKGLIESEKMLF